MREEGDSRPDADARDECATELLERLRSGDSSAANELLPLVYDRLRALAGACMRGQATPQTLEPTALVHEAYIKLARSDTDWESRAHFCAVAATAMRQVLMNYSRDKRAAKRGGGAVAVTLDEVAGPTGARALDLVALEEALEKLGELNARHARLVELRFFTGLDNREIAHVLDVSTATVEKDWRKVRAWLNRELTLGETPD